MLTFIVYRIKKEIMATIKLKNISTRAPKRYNKEKTKIKTEEILLELDDLQNLLYAEGKHAILVVIQGMDASGKDGVIRDVFGELNPQGVTVKSFKVPTEEEMAHDFLWRIHAAAPRKGLIQIFNRSQYEDILVTRVHKLNERIHDPAKMWKYNEKDFEEAKHWDIYMKMYEDCFAHCNAVPWHIIPADQNWYKEYLIASALHSTLKQLNMQYPGLKK